MHHVGDEIADRNAARRTCRTLLLPCAAVDLEMIETEVARLRTLRKDELGELLRAVRSEAGSVGLPVLPMDGFGGPHVMLDTMAIAATEVVSTAVTLGAKVFYVSSTARHADSLLNLFACPLAEQAPKLAKDLQREIKRLDGWLESISLAFSHDGILHVWDEEAPLGFSELRRLLVDLEDEFTQPEEDLPPQRARLSETEVDALVEQALAHPGFLDGRDPYQRREAARTIPALAGQSDFHVVMHRAEARLDELKRSWSGRLESRLSELARELAGHAEFRAAATSARRKHVAAKWIRGKTDGVPIRGWLSEELAKLADDARKTAPQSQLMF